ncbi:YadA-like family protein [Pasteurella sp. P03HT]
MNLSKIAAGLAVSFGLVSNVIAMDSMPAAPSQAAPSQAAPSLLEKNTYSKSLLEKAKERFDRLSSDLDIDKRLSSISSSLEHSSNPLFLEFSDEEVEKLFDYYGYGEAIIRLGNMANDPEKFKHYYPLVVLNDEININKNKIDDNLEGIKIIGDSINRVASNKADIDDLIKNSNKIEENKKLIEDNKSILDENTKNISENKKLINDNKSAIEVIGKDIVENNNKIALNKKAIETMNKQLSSRLDNLNKSLKSGLATQSALNGLFQPYNIGKMNVSAALGGYKSHNALAVGAGFRFNKNVAAKAGISSSFDGSALSYNMGVNYEF